MLLERKSPGMELIDVLDRVLDKGILMDASTRLHLATIDLHYANARMTVASMETYLGHGETRPVGEANAGTNQASPKRSDLGTILKIDRHSRTDSRSRSRKRA